MAETGVLWVTGLLSVAAIMTAPVTALWVQRKIEADKALKDRRETIFKALWVNRRRQMWIARIDALNMIDIEFVGHDKVLDAWHALFAHYVRTDHPGTTDQIFDEREELFATLVFEISRVLKYKFNRTYVRDNIYKPVFHNQLDELELETKHRIAGLLKLDALPVRFVGAEPVAPGGIPLPPIQDEAKATTLAQS